MRVGGKTRMKNSWYLLFLSRGKERRVHFASLEESSSYFKNSVSKSKQSMIETFARVTRRLVENSCAEGFPFALPSFFPSMPLEGFTRIVKDTRAQIYRLENTERTVVIIIVRYRMKSEKDRRRGTDDRTEGRNVNGLFTAHRLEAARRTVNFPT